MAGDSCISCHIHDIIFLSLSVDEKYVQQRILFGKLSAAFGKYMYFWKLYICKVFLSEEKM